MAAAIHISVNTTSFSDQKVIKTKLRRSIDWHRKKGEVYTSRLAGSAEHIAFPFFTQIQQPDPALQGGSMPTTFMIINLLKSANKISRALTKRGRMAEGGGERDV